MTNFNRVLNPQKTSAGDPTGENLAKKINRFWQGERKTKNCNDLGEIIWLNVKK